MKLKKTIYLRRKEATLKNVTSAFIVCLILLSSLLSAKNTNLEYFSDGTENPLEKTDKVIIEDNNNTVSEPVNTQARIYLTNGALIYDSLKISNVIICKVTISKRKEKIAKKENSIKKQDRKKLIKTSANLVYYNSLKDENKIQSIENTKMALFVQSHTLQYSKNTNNDSFSWAKYVSIKQRNKIHYNSPHISNLHFEGTLSVRPPTFFL